MREEGKKLIEMVRKGVPDKEIMEKIGVHTKASLKKMYYDALVEAGKIKDIVTEKEVETKKTLKVTKRGTILLGRALLIGKFGFKEGEKFAVSKRKDGIVLTKVKESPE